MIFIQPIHVYLYAWQPDSVSTRVFDYLYVYALAESMMFFLQPALNF